MPGRGFETAFLVGHGALQRGAHARLRRPRDAGSDERTAGRLPVARPAVRPAAARQSTRLSSAFV
ncbi:hypothetical protein C7S14_2402 [Burkholderia cepacia]|nr:hypothetical protein C7S14_2402 [Burkholderia cepacia]